MTYKPGDEVTSYFIQHSIYIRAIFEYAISKKYARICVVTPEGKAHSIIQEIKDLEKA